MIFVRNIKSSETLETFLNLQMFIGDFFVVDLSSGA